jgi:hypothetical protein
MTERSEGMDVPLERLVGLLTEPQRNLLERLRTRGCELRLTMRKHRPMHALHKLGLADYRLEPVPNCGRTRLVIVAWPT